MTAKTTPVYGCHLILRSLLLLGTLLWVIPRAQAANTWNVPGDFSTIQDAINVAAAGDTIVVAAGTYHESLSWGGRDLTIQGAGADTANNPSIIDPSGANGGPGGRCLSTSGLTPATTISGFVFQGGNASSGGGMYNNFSSPTLTNCTFTANSASVTGGGMHNESSTPTLVNCTIEVNSASSGGGGMYNDGDASNPTLIDCFFYFNSSSDGGSGGGMYNAFASRPTVTGCIFVGNNSEFGGGIYNNYASPNLNNCTFNYNRAKSIGGLGGGMYNESSSPTVRNCIFWDNLASSGGDGIFNDNSTPIVFYSDVQDLPNSTPDVDGNFAADPMFVASDDLRLLSGSPCQNAGDNAVVTSPPFRSVGSIIIDLDGNPRISGGRVDLGPYEIQETPTAPVANAGPDQTVEANATCQATVTLDGSASTGSALTFTWREGTTDLGNGANPSITLSGSGNHVITLTVQDSQGNPASDSVIVFVQDITPPVPDVANLPTDSDVCGVTIPTAPTATDNCSGRITGITTDSLTYRRPGIHIVTWTYRDGNGNTTTQTQQVEVLPDTLPPVPNAASLPTVSGQCSVTISTIPTAIDNCVRTITGVTSDPLTYTVPGTYTVTWTYYDGNGNSVTQQQTVIVQAEAATTLAYNGATSSAPSTPVTLSATLSTGTGKKTQKLAGQLIKFGLGTTSASAVTDATGTARVTLTAPGAAGSYPLSASYAGVCPYAASSVSKTFTVRKK